MSIKNKVGNVLLAGGLVYGALWFGTEQGYIPDCLFPNPVACMSLPHVDGHQEPAKAKFGNLDIKAENLTGTAQVQVFGEVTMKVGGTPSTFDYDSKALIDSNDVDATLYWNRDGKQTETLVYNPCIKVSDDYTKATADHPQTVGNTEFGVPNKPQQSGVNWTIDVVKEPGPDQGKIRKITVDAGILDTCFMRIPNLPENQLIWSYNKANQGMFGSTEEATFRWMQEELLARYSLSQACPEAVVNIEAIKKDIAKTVIGEIVSEHPEAASGISEAVKAGEVDVNLQPPDVRRAKYQQDLQVTLTQIGAMTRSFPDPAHNNKTYALKEPKLGNFAVKSCAASTPVAVKPAA